MTSNGGASQAGGSSTGGGDTTGTSGSSSNTSSSSGGGGGSIASLDVVWADEIGTSTGTLVQALATDGSGSTFVAGIFEDNLVLGPDRYACQTQYDCGFLAKLDSNGRSVWSASFIGYISSVSLALAPDGSIVVDGGLRAPTDFGQGAIDGSVYLARFQANGVLEFAVPFDGPGSVEMNGLAIQADGDLVVSGVTTNGIDFGTGVSDAGHFIATLDPNAALRWVAPFLANQIGATPPIAVTAAGDIVVAGGYQGGPILGCDPLPGNASAYVARLDASGNCLVAKPLGDANPTTIAVDPSDDGIAVAGGISGTVDVGSKILTSNEYDGLLVRLDSNADPIWGISFGDAEYQIVNHVAIDAATGDIGITGITSGTANFGDGPKIAPSGNGNAFFAAYDDTGMLKWDRLFGSSFESVGEAAAYAGSGHVVLGGSFSGIFLFTSSFIEAPSDRDGFAFELVQP
jgi:hypothetical protein